MNDLFKFFAKHKKLYELQIPTHLLQSIRVYHALMEAGVPIYIPPEELGKFQYLAKFFPLKLYTKSNTIIKASNVSLSHSEPYVAIGEEKRILLFPHGVVDRCKRLWQEKRDYDFLFLGLVTESRKEFLKNMESKLNPYQDKKIYIKNSSKGREFPGKAWDEDYYSMMAKAKLVLCPNGDFIWTYRFYEAVLCGAIPVVEDDSELYRGYKYYKSSDPVDKMEWSSKIALNNFELASSMLTIPKDAIKKQLAQNG